MSHIPYTDDNLNNQVEIKENGELLDENGILKIKGWSRQPYLKYNPEQLSKFRKSFRLKEWNYYSIGSNSFYFAVVAIDLGYVCIYQCFFIDFEKDYKNLNENQPQQPSEPSDYIMDEIRFATPFSKGLCLPSDSCEHGCHTKYDSNNFSIEFNSICSEHLHKEDESGDSNNNNNNNNSKIKHHIKFYSKKSQLEGDIVFDLSPNRESIVLMTPIGKENFYYNRKTNLIPVGGSLKVKGVEQLNGDINSIANDCFGIMDWGRGIWEYNSFWLWSSAWGKVDGIPVGLNFGSGFGDLSTHTENGVNVNGIVHKLGRVDIEYNESNLMEPWKFICKHGRFGEQPLIFTPFKKKYDNNDFTVFISSFHQILGTFTGEIILDDGSRLKINLIGFSEVHKARW
ncbi:hypothetical protein ACTFIR_005813 [Dictyostelium discoideum]